MYDGSGLELEWQNEFRLVERQRGKRVIPFLQVRSRESSLKKIRKS